MKRWRLIAAGFLAGAVLVGTLVTAFGSSGTRASDGTNAAQRAPSQLRVLEREAGERELKLLAARRAQREAEIARLDDEERRRHAREHARARRAARRLRGASSARHREPPAHGPVRAPARSTPRGPTQAAREQESEAAREERRQLRHNQRERTKGEREEEAELQRGERRGP